MQADGVKMTYFLMPLETWEVTQQSGHCLMLMKMCLDSKYEDLTQLSDILLQMVANLLFSIVQRTTIILSTFQTATEQSGPQLQGGSCKQVRVYDWTNNISSQPDFQKNLIAPRADRT
jgi:hypothetical protein